MFYYAQLNQDNLCIGISQFPKELENELLIPINEYDHDYIYRYFVNGEWSKTKFIEEVETINEIDVLKEKTQRLEEYIDEHEAALMEIMEMILGGNE